MSASPGVRRRSVLRAITASAGTFSLADCVLLAAAGDEDRIATADSDVLAVAVELGIETIELPPSSG